MRSPADVDCTPAELFAGLWPCVTCGAARCDHSPNWSAGGDGLLHCLDRGSVTPMVYTPAPIATLFPAAPRAWRAG